MYKTYSFNSNKAIEIGKALAGNYAIEINNQWYFPVEAKYNKRYDTITFKLELTFYIS